MQAKFEEWQLLSHVSLSAKDCQGFPECPMIVDEVWAKIGPKRNFLLCLECAEKETGSLLYV